MQPVKTEQPQPDSAQELNRLGILNAVSSWLRLLALIVLAVEAVLVVGIVRSGDGDPLRGWYIPLMLGFFSVIVIGLFLDRRTPIAGPESLDPETQEAIKTPKDLPNERRWAEPHTGKIWTIRFAPDAAIVSTTPRAELLDKVEGSVFRTLYNHSWALRYPNPSVLIPVNGNYFARLSWGDQQIICHQIFELPRDTDPKYWRAWSGLQEGYVEAFTAPYRQTGKPPTRISLEKVAYLIDKVCEGSEYLMETYPECASPANRVLHAKLRQYLDGLDLDNDSETASNAVVRLEMALSTAHNLMRNLMPRVISI